MRQGDKTKGCGLMLACLALAVSGCGPSTEPTPKATAIRVATDAAADDTPRIYSTIPPFELTSQSGEAFGSAELAGSTWVANFIFTSCPGTCPVQTRFVKLLQDRLESEAALSEIRLVSFTVDPQTDTPEVLREYGTAVGADFNRWTFLTGGRDALWQLSKDGFKLPVGDAPPGGDGPILHATKLMLVDPAGQVRGYYDGLSEQGLDQLQADLARVLDGS